MAKAQPVTKPADPQPEREKVTAATEVELGAFRIPQYRIRAARASGIWRAGRFWPAEGVEVSEDDFTEAQWEQLRAEPVLSINRVEQE